MSKSKLTRTDLKIKAQEELAHMVAKVFQHVHDSGFMQDIPASQHQEFEEVLERQADRVARLLGFEKSWKS